jgi:hypothetical protein
MNKIITGLALVFLCNIVVAEKVEDQGYAPFETITRTNDTLIATFPETGTRWRIERQYDPSKSRISNYGEKITLTNGMAISLIDRHQSYEIRAVIAEGKATLHYTVRNDLRSFGKDLTVTEKVIEIRETEPVN